MGPIIGHRIDYYGVGALRGQQHIHSKNLLKYSPPPTLITGTFHEIKVLEINMT